MPRTVKPPPGTAFNRSHPLYPVAYPYGGAILPLDEGSGTPRLYLNGTNNFSSLDVGESHLATVTNGPTWKSGSGRWGGPVMTLAATSELNLGPHHSFLGSRTDATIVYAFKQTGADGHILAKPGGTVGQLYLATLIAGSPNSVYFYWGGTTLGTDAIQATTNAPLGDDIYVFSVGSRGMEVWQNGSLIGSQTGHSTMFNHQNDIVLANTAFWGTAAVGDIGFVYFYSRQLSQDEIRYISNDPFCFYDWDEDPSKPPAVQTLSVGGTLSTAGAVAKRVSPTAKSGTLTTAGSLSPTTPRTRLYFGSSIAADAAPAFNAGWDYTTQATRWRLNHVKGSSPIVAGSRIAWTPLPLANLGANRTAFINEPLSLDASASTGAYDGFQTDGRHSIQWDFGYGGFTYEGSLVAPIAYPEAGVYTVTLTIYDSSGNSSSDTATVTVSAITLGSETVLTDTGNAVTNMTNLQAAVDAAVAVNNKVITLPATARFSGTLTLKHRTVANYCTIRTANYTSLPDSKSRVSPSDATNMAIIEQSADANILETPATSTSPANYYNFLGIQFRKATASSAYTHTFVQLGQGDETTLNQLPHHILFDRCYFDGGSTTSNTLRGINFRATDSGIANSYLYRFKGAGIETQAVLILMGERINVMNNYIQAASECSLVGGGDPTITNHIPSDLIFRRNHYQKDVGWLATDPSYYGVNMSVKNIFELKLGNRVSVQGNIFQDHWIEDQSYAITFTPRNQDGNAAWSNVQYVDFAHNKIHKCGRGVEWTGTDDLQPSGTQNHIIFRHDVWTGVSFYNGNFNTYSIFGGIQHLAIINNSTDQDVDPFTGQGRWIEFDVTTGVSNLIVWGNIGQGFVNQATGGTGDGAFAAACTSYSVLKNGFYRSRGTNPSGNSTVSLIADVMYTNLAGFDLSLAGGSPFLTTGLLGAPSGADVATVDTLTGNVVTGAW